MFGLGDFWLETRVGAKRLDHLGPSLGGLELADLWVLHEILSEFACFGFSETSQNLISFRELLFASFHRKDSFKKSPNPKNLPKFPKLGPR